MQATHDKKCHPVYFYTSVSYDFVCVDYTHCVDKYDYEEWEIGGDVVLR